MHRHRQKERGGAWEHRAQTAPRKTAQSQAQVKNPNLDVNVGRRLAVAGPPGFVRHHRNVVRIASTSLGRCPDCWGCTGFACWSDRPRGVDVTGPGTAVAATGRQPGAAQVALAGGDAVRCRDRMRNVIAGAALLKTLIGYTSGTNRVRIASTSESCQDPTNSVGAQ